jgi:hypothetical protein
MTRNYTKPNALIVAITSDDGAVDLEVMIKRGGSLNLALESGPEDPHKPFQLGLPGGLRDQRRWVCDGDGMRPARPGEFPKKESE